MAFMDDMKKIKTKIKLSLYESLLWVKHFSYEAYKLTKHNLGKSYEA